jgi:hypothetical protein|tara:strand:- start:29 stop:235 length:207 start_codon:yes stop_codon:yes gene_type:complete
VQVGDLVKFPYVNGHTKDINNRHAVYLGEAFIVRDDGVVVENHKILLQGDTQPTTIDKGLLRWLAVIR